jgi:hypothetical protein
MRKVSKTQRLEARIASNGQRELIPCVRMYIRKCDALLTKARGKEVDERSNHHHYNNRATIDNTTR